VYYARSVRFAQDDKIKNHIPPKKLYIK